MPPTSCTPSSVLPCCGLTHEPNLIQETRGRQGAALHTHSAQFILGHTECMAGPCIAKIHEYEPALLLDFDTVVTSHRDLRDVLMSVSQTFGSCLDPQCSDQQTIDFSVAAHFKHYALWRRHAVYDMKYENMVKSPSSEVQAIALSLGIVCSKTVADSIVSKVLDFSAKAQESKNPWDKSTGFSKSHNHASAKVQAYLDKALVQNLSIPNGPCNLRKEFQTIEDRYSLWMNEMKYTGRSTARMDGSKQTELELNRNRNKNQAKEDYEEIETETETKDGLHKMSISHVINYFVHRGGTNRSDVDGKTRGFQSWEAALTQASIVDAHSHAHAAGITVNVIAAIFPGDEDALGELESIATICYLKQQRTAFLKVSRNNRRMPLLTEILHCAGTRYTGEGNNPRLQEQVVVYTNADIGVQLDFLRARGSANANPKDGTGCAANTRAQSIQLQHHASRASPPKAVGEMVKVAVRYTKSPV